MEHMLSTSQVAERLGVHRTTVLRLVAEGLIAGQVYRRATRATIRIPESALTAFLRRWSDEPLEPPSDRGGR
ncbi:MAG: helix-turn-helix domain-containing protein [Candidatus Limnocylindrales bacterium]